MLKKTIKYTDYSGVERTEDFYFHISRAELMELELSKNGGLENWLSSVVQAKDGAELWSLFSHIIEMSYGVKSPDGRQFKKSPEITKAFTETEAYSELLMEFVQDTDSAVAFFKGLMAGVSVPGNQDKPSLTIV